MGLYYFTNCTTMLVQIINNIVLEAFMDNNEIKDAKKPLYYANTASVESSAYDMVLGFGIKKDRTANGFNQEDIDFTVIMSVQHAKSLCNILSENLKKYEEAFGTVNYELKNE